MRKESILALAVLFFGGIIILALANKNGGSVKNPFTSPTPFPTITSNNGSSPISMAPASSQNIEVLTPRSGDNVKSGFAVKGNARVFENVVSIRLVDSQGNVLFENYTEANSPDTGQFGPFEMMINYESDDTEGTLEVFQYSAKDGSEIDKVSVPLQI